MKIKAVYIVKFVCYVTFCSAARSLVGIPPHLNRKTWIFPENATETVTENNHEKELEHCQVKIRNKEIPGFCLKLTDCPVLLSGIATQRERPTVCHYDGTEPIICCPNTVIEEKSIKLVDSGCGFRPISSNSSRLVRGNQSPLIAGGHEALPFSWPWMVAIFRKYGSTLRYHCGAVLIGEKYILSAAHCFAGGGRTNNPAHYVVRIGVHDRNNGTLFTLSSIVLHNQYNARQHYNDIAVLTTSVKITGTDSKLLPVCLPSSNQGPSEGTTVIATGWGDTSFGGTDSNTLQEVGLMMLGNQNCDEAYKNIAATSFPKGVTSNMVCAGVKTGGRDACQGDSGGPLVHRSGSSWVLVGIISFGYGCAQPGYPGVYTRASSYLDWISNNTV